MEIATPLEKVTARAKKEIPFMRFLDLLAEFFVPIRLLDSLAAILHLSASDQKEEAASFRDYSLFTTYGT